jgi:AhpD family alkylhydroperoxidase
MQQRLNIKLLEPEAYKAMYVMEQYLRTTNISLTLIELVKIRASQINGCAYCIQMHTKEARNGGETEQRIYALSAWWESPLFTEQEKAALAMTDEITKISKKGLTEDTFQKVKEHFDENTIAQLIILINAINSWNRIAVATHMFHPSE